MMLRLGIVIGILLVGCAALIAGVRLLAQSIPPPPAHIETGSCSQPCWLGFKPGNFTVDQLKSLGRDDGPYEISHVTTHGGETVMDFEVQTAGRIALADVLREFGLPERVGCLELDYPRLPSGSAPVLTAQLFYFDGLVAVYAIGDSGDLRLNPGMNVINITYYRPGEPAYPVGANTGWYGLASMHRYCLKTEQE